MNNTKKPMVRFSDFASIELGYPLNKGWTMYEPYYEYKEYMSPLYAEASIISCYHTPIPEKYLTREGDIIINPAKFNDIVLITKDQEGLLVSNYFLIIRCDPKTASPGFIHSELLSDSGCEKRRKICRDAVLPLQKAKKYAELKFRLPSLEMQEEIYELRRLLDETTRKITEAWTEKLKQEDEERRKRHEQYMQAINSCYGRLVQSADDSASDTDESCD